MLLARIDQPCHRKFCQECCFRNCKPTWGHMAAPMHGIVEGTFPPLMERQEQGCFKCFDAIYPMVGCPTDSCLWQWGGRGSWEFGYILVALIPMGADRSQQPLISLCKVSNSGTKCWMHKTLQTSEASKRLWCYCSNKGEWSHLSCADLKKDSLTKTCWYAPVCPNWLACAGLVLGPSWWPPPACADDGGWWMAC